VVETSGFHAHQYLAGLEQRQILEPNLDDLRAARPQRPSDATLSN
jgi:hypothetical protein